MADRLAEAAARLSARIGAKASSPVTYRRGAVELETTAARGASYTAPLESGADGAALVSVDALDFVFAGDAVAIFAAGEFGEPREGDELATTVDGRESTWRVVPLAGGNCWRWCDGHERMIRVHAIKVEES